MDATWYEHFFHGIAVDVWRKAVTPGQTRSEVDCLTRVLSLPPASRVLDVPCGFGRHSLELAARGFHVSGVDFSPDMLEEARRNALDAGLTIEWRRADMRDLPWDAEFDAAFCFGNSFGYLDVEGTRAFVGSVVRTLKRGGRFALDSGMAAECILPGLREREWARVDDILFLEENRYIVEHGCLETTYTFVRDGATHTRTGLHWVFTVSEILRLLRHGEKPVIAAVNGAALGGGLGLVAAADIAIAADSAQMSFSEVRIGAIPAMISVVVLPKLGPHQTMRLFLTGERFDAKRAQDYGLLHRVVPAAELATAVEAEVLAIAQGGPNAVREAKQLIRRVEELPEDEAFAFAERKIAELFASEEAAEGMKAFAERRPPRWAPRSEAKA
jgi:enoyl-CoA hydratase/carnithine racemase